MREGAPPFVDWFAGKLLIIRTDSLSPGFTDNVGAGNCRFESRGMKLHMHRGHWTLIQHHLVEMQAVRVVRSSPARDWRTSGSGKPDGFGLAGARHVRRGRIDLWTACRNQSHSKTYAHWEYQGPPARDAA